MAILTHMIEPMREWELDAGIPRYHVPAFQMIADMSKAKTTQTPNEVFCSAMTSSGRRCMIHMATPIPQKTTPQKFMTQEIITAFWGSRDFVYITGATAFAVSWNPFTNSNKHTSPKQRARRAKTQRSIQNIKIIVKILNDNRL